MSRSVIPWAGAHHLPRTVAVAVAANVPSDYLHSRQATRVYHGGWRHCTQCEGNVCRPEGAAVGVP